MTIKRSGHRYQLVPRPPFDCLGRFGQHEVRCHAHNTPRSLKIEHINLNLSWTSNRYISVEGTIRVATLDSQPPLFLLEFSRPPIFRLERFWNFLVIIMEQQRFASYTPVFKAHTGCHPHTVQSQVDGLVATQEIASVNLEVGAGGWIITTETRTRNNRHDLTMAVNWRAVFAA